jgi:hypothetical protein
MVNGAKWFLPQGSALSRYFENALCCTGSALAAHTIEPLAHGFRDRRGHAFSSQFRELLRQSMGFFVLDVKTHGFYLSTL